MHLVVKLLLRTQLEMQHAKRIPKNGIFQDGFLQVALSLDHRLEATVPVVSSKTAWRSMQCVQPGSILVLDCWCF